MTVNDRYALSAVQRLEGFKASFELYKKQRLIDSLSSETTIQLLPNADSVQDVHVRLTRAAALRKFVLGEKDPFYLIKIHDCIVELGQISLDGESRTSLENLLLGLHSGQVGPVAIHERSDGNPTPDSHIVDDALNGAALHSDPEKMWRHISRDDLSTNLALFSWLHQAEALCEIAYELTCRTLASSELE